MIPALPERRMRPGTEAAMDLTDAQFAAITRRIHRDTGIVIGTAKRSMLISRLAHRLRHLDLPDFEAYTRLLDSPVGEEERLALVSAITTNVTKFFREPHHFEALSTLAPALVDRARTGGRVRLWSAGCSTGEEAYSIAATLIDLAPDLAQHDLRILATDIDPKVIDTARHGQYDRRGIGPDTPPLLHRFLQEGPEGQVAVSPKLGALIRFETLNLLEPWPFRGLFDIIFCRNVVIYFDADTRHALWRRFASRIVAGGQLFIGHSERMDSRLEPFFEPSGITRYRRTDRGLTDETAPPRPTDPTARNASCPSETP